MLAPAVSPVPVLCGTSIYCRSWLQYLSIVHGSSSICRSWLQYLSSRPVASVAAPGSSSICCRLWLQWWLSLLLWLQYHLLSSVSLVAPVSVDCGGSSGCRCRLWLQYLSFAAPVSSICCRSWLQQYLLSFVALVVVVFSPSCGSGICCTVVCGSGISCRRSWLQYLSLAPVAPPVAQVLSNVTSCGSKLSLVAPVAVVVACPVAPLTGSHLVFWRFFCQIGFYCCISPSIDS